ncbi:ependymin [Polymixia lowei]
MYATATLFVFMCLTATTIADHHQPCHSPNMTGIMSVVEVDGDIKAVGEYVYDALAKKLRFKSNETDNANTSVALDVLMFFEEGVFYEIDGKNHSCEKKSLQSVLHPLEIPSNAKFLSKMLLGSTSIEDEGLKINLWTGTVAETKGLMTQFNMQIETEIKDPELLTLPSFCEGEAVEETPEGTVNTFFNLFI